MQRLNCAEFKVRFPRPNPEEHFPGMSDTLVADTDMLVAGVVHDLIVRPGAKVVVTGLVQKSLIVDQGATVYIDGLIDGDATVNGALCIDGGHVAGKIRGSGTVADSSGLLHES